MKRNVLAFLLAAAASAPAAAVTIPVGDINAYQDVTPYIDVGGTPAGLGSGSFANTYTFSLGQRSTVNVSLTDQKRLTGLSAFLYRSVGGPALMSLGSLMGTGDYASWQSATPLAAGNYYVDVAGNFGNKTGAYALQLSSDVAAPVPGPAGFLVAGVGGAMALYRRRRNKRAEIAA